MWCCSGGTRAQPGYCNHVWAVEASRKYRAQRLRPDATTIAPEENAIFADEGSVKNIITLVGLRVLWANQLLWILTHPQSTMVVHVFMMVA